MSSHEISQVMSGYLDENQKLMDRPELNKRIAMKDAVINKVKFYAECLFDMSKNENSDNKDNNLVVSNTLYKLLGMSRRELIQNAKVLEVK